MAPRDDPGLYETIFFTLENCIRPDNVVLRPETKSNSRVRTHFLLSTTHTPYCKIQSFFHGHQGCNWYASFIFRYRVKKISIEVTYMMVIAIGGVFQVGCSVDRCVIIINGGGWGGRSIIYSSRSRAPMIVGMTIYHTLWMVVVITTVDKPVTLLY